MAEQSLERRGAYPDQALAVVDPGSPEPPFRLARSLEAATVGEVMALDERGDVVGPGRSRAAAARLWLGAAAIGGLGWASVATLGGAALLGPAFLAGCLGLLAWESRRLQELKRAIALAAAGRREDAKAAFDMLERRKARPAQRATLHYWQGCVAWQLGDLDGAAARFDEALALARAFHRLDVLVWIIQFSRAQLMAVRGQLDSARTIRDELQEAPDGAYFRLARRLTDLTIAFHQDDASQLSGDLYEWATGALEMTRFGQSLVLLAWVFDKQGDRDMAVHLLREAPERLEACYLEECDPVLFAWMQKARADWNVEAESDDV